MVEWEALLAGLIRPTAPHAQTPAAPPSEAEWGALIRSTPGALHPWLSHCLERRFGSAEIPAAVAYTLAQARRGAAVGLLRRQALLRRLLPALEAAGVISLVLKGGALAYQSYPEPSLRPMDDIDLWVSPADLDRAVSVAAEVGVVHTSRYRDRGSAENDPQQAMTRVLECPGYGLVIEVHGALKSLEGMSAQWIERAWKRREKRALGDVQAWVMHPQDMLTHLAVHGARKDRFNTGLRPLLDIALLVESDDGRMDWPSLLSEWERERVVFWALLAIKLASDLLGAPIANEVARRIERSPGFDQLLKASRQLVLGSALTLPPTMARLVASTPRERAAWIFSRLTAWYWKGPPGSSRSVGQILHGAAGRMGHDLRYKVGPYLRALLQGHFWGADFRRRREIAVGRQRLLTLVEQLESGTKQPPASDSRGDTTN